MAPEGFMGPELFFYLLPGLVSMVPHGGIPYVLNGIHRRCDMTSCRSRADSNVEIATPKKTAVIERVQRTVTHATAYSYTRIST